MSRKTIGISSLRDTTNKYLSANTTIDERKGAIAMLEFALHVADQYHGFTYLTHYEVPMGVKPGINIDMVTGHLLDGNERFEDTDDTRRKYF